jgi:hypothetical protein
MDPDSIQKIAAEVVKSLPGSYSWTALIVQFSLTLIAVAIGVFLGEYLKTRGRNLATKADFKSLVDQLRINTELVENIKAEVAQSDWAKREWTNLRRVKLEALLDKMHDCTSYIERAEFLATTGELNTDRVPVSELETIATLYFPELEASVVRFRDAYLVHVGDHLVHRCGLRQTCAHRP